MDLHIQQLECHYQVTSAAGEAHILQNRLDEIAQEFLPRLLDGVLANLGNAGGLSGAQEPYLFIESMQVNLGLALTQGGDYDLALQWARQLERGIQHSLQRRDGGVLIFWQRADYLAGFVRYLLDGNTRRSWVYAEFAGLEDLPAGQVVLQVLTADRDQGRDALLELARGGELERVLGLLSEDETERLVYTCLLPASPTLHLRGSLSIWVEALLDFFSNGRLRLTHSPAGDLARGYLYLLVEREYLGPDVNLARFLEGLLGLRREAGAATWKRLVGALEQEDWRAAQAVVPSAYRELLRAAHGAVGGPRLAELLGSMEPASPPALRKVSSPLAGACLLVRSAMQLDLYSFLETCSLPVPAQESKAGLLFFVILVQCMGAEQARLCLADGGLALLAGLTRPPAMPALRDYAASLHLQDYAALHAGWLAHLESLSRRAGYRHLVPPVVWEQRADKVHPLAGEFVFPFDDSPQPVSYLDTLLNALGPISAQLLAQFAASLGSFTHSSPAYLRRNFFLTAGEIEIFADRWSVRLKNPPLQIVLRMAGLDGAAWKPDWLHGLGLEVHFD